MLSYQHIYHAGNLADVHKHAVLSLLLQTMIGKDKPFTYMETHAGRGIYNLHSEEALKTAEAQKGILGTDLTKLPLPYVTAINKIHKNIGENFYPGSPLIARILLRDNDIMNLMELHPQEYASLHRNMSVFANTHIHKRDGYEGVLALSPPTPRRGFVLIDPSYEIKTEYEQAGKFILKLHKKWAESVIMLWYPLLKEKYYQELKNIITEAKLPKVTTNEVIFKEISKENGMLGSGIMIINTPFGADEQIKTLKIL